MADKIIPNLPKTETVTIDDLVLVVDTPSSTPTNKKITIKNFFKNIFVQGNSAAADTITLAGEVSLTYGITWIVSSTAIALTLAAGTEGQIKFIVMKTDGGAATLTPANTPANYSAIEFQDVGDSAQLLFTNAAWHIVGSHGVTIAA